jgi:hypothetical protein
MAYEITPIIDNAKTGENDITNKCSIYALRKLILRLCGPPEMGGGDPQPIHTQHNISPRTKPELTFLSHLISSSKSTMFV